MIVGINEFIVSEYSLVISIVGTIIGLILAIVGSVCKTKGTVITGSILLVFFLIVCGVLLAIRYSSGSSGDDEAPVFSQTTTAEPTKMPQLAATPAPTETPRQTATPAPTATPQPVSTPVPTATPTPVEVWTTSTVIPRPDSTASAPDIVPDSERTLDIASIEASVWNVSPIDSSDMLILPAEIKTFSGDISLLEQKDEYSYVPEVGGIYRFEFSDVPSGTYYKLYVFNSGNERIKYSTDLDNGDGITVSLEAGQSYTIRVEQHKNVGSYILNVGPQKPLVDVSQWTAVNDSIQYTEQENNYSFIAPRDGIYRFDLSDVPEGTDLSIYAYNSGWERIKYAVDLDNGDGISVELSKGQTYYIKAVQYRGVGNYTLNIGHKKEIVDISAYTAVTDSIQYTDQENDYAFVPSVSGTYRFEFSEVPDGTDLSLYIYNSGWERLKYAVDLDNRDGISFEFSAGMTYYIRVSQYRKYGTYKLRFF